MALVPWLAAVVDALPLTGNTWLVAFYALMFCLCPATKHGLDFGVAQVMFGVRELCWSTLCKRQLGQSVASRSVLKRFSLVALLHLNKVEIVDGHLICNTSSCNLVMCLCLRGLVCRSCIQRRSLYGKMK